MNRQQLATGNMLDSQIALLNEALTKVQGSKEMFRVKSHKRDAIIDELRKGIDVLPDTELSVLQDIVERNILKLIEDKEQQLLQL